ncbi:hypothetical protein [Chlamydiifrater phoenicopteri]|uniref:hypothetical protein n=1 Tax=Chlamydiifrater phoenicopteri TaxID=2681469 RepID=UPI001BCD3EB9|nr:hypothetical protein [Chlamydiifrater phoenicopteri]
MTKSLYKIAVKGFSSFLLISSTFVLNSCQNRTHFKGVTIAERVSSQKNSSVIFLPTNYSVAPPCYSWQPNFSHIITKHSFYCRGTDQILDRPPFQDCKGLFSHGLPIKNGREFINPRLVQAVAILYQVFSKEYTITIREGYSCKRHFLFKKSIGEPLNPKHLSGNAATLTITSSNLEDDLSAIFFIEKLTPSLKKMYPRTAPSDYTFAFSPYQITNKELAFSFEPLANGVEIFIETFYESENLHSP